MRIAQVRDNPISEKHTAAAKGIAYTLSRVYKPEREIIAQIRARRKSQIKVPRPQRSQCAVQSPPQRRKGIVLAPARVVLCPRHLHLDDFVHQLLLGNQWSHL